MILNALRLGSFLFTYDAPAGTVHIARGEDEVRIPDVNLHEWSLFADAADKGLQGLPLRIRMSSSRGIDPPLGGTPFGA